MSPTWRAKLGMGFASAPYGPRARRENDSKYLSYLIFASCHTEDLIIYGDKGDFGEPNRSFLALNDIEDGIIRKDTTGAKLTEYEVERNKAISKKRHKLRILLIVCSGRLVP